MNIPPFNWIPPEWTTAKPDLTTDPNSQANPPVFNKPDEPKGPGGTPKLNGGIDLQPRVNALKGSTTANNTHFIATRDLEDPEGADTGNPLTEVSHPRSDFRHVDPGFNGKPFLPAIGNLRSLKGQAGLDGEANNAFKKALPPLDDLENMLTPNPKGMQRLKLVSDHILVRIITLFGEMNVALAGAGNQGAYNAARAEYIELLKDLDNREPQTVTPGKSGYGRSVQWFYVRPIIHKLDGKIKGAVVQAKWNPHLSSSGIPIPHG